VTLKRESEGGAPADPVVVPRASVFLIEAQPNRPLTHVVSAIRSRYPKGRVLAIAEKFNEANAFPLLQLSTKGFLRYSEVANSLERAVRAVVGGGFWVPRSLLSRFVDSTVEGSRRPKFAAGVHLSRREREVVALLLENRSNKEIAGALNMSERTAKFHVSNLLSKYGVKRRADLILLSFGQTQTAAS
jgi:DNA-binding NarL/FixJ family response regulator